ncbi:hypothetical protein JCM16358_00670 [Halanaerocella petrolearia]
MESLYNEERRKLAKEYNQSQKRFSIYKLIFKLLFWGIVIRLIDRRKILSLIRSKDQ